MLFLGIGPMFRAPRKAARKRRSVSSLLYSSFELRVMAESEQPFQEDFRELCYHIGLALVTWQRARRTAFPHFRQVLGRPAGSNCVRRLSQHRKL